MNQPNADTPQTRLIARRSAWAAGILSVLAAGLGQVYCGRLTRGALIAAGYLPVLLITVLAFTHVALGPIVWGLLVIIPAAWTVWVVVDAVILARRFEPRPHKPYQRWWFYLGYALVAIVWMNLLGYGSREWIAEAFIVPTNGMADTIIGGDRVMCDKLVSSWRPIQHGDVVVFWIFVEQPFPRTGTGAPRGQWECYVKRVIGLPGDVIGIVDEQVIRNGEPLVEPYAKFTGDLPDQRIMGVDMANIPKQTVPEGEFFFIGDHRRLSLDSRFLGTIPLSQIIGRATSIVWSHAAEAAPPLDPMKAEQAPSMFDIRWGRLGNRIEYKRSRNNTGAAAWCIIVQQQGVYHERY